MFPAQCPHVASSSLCTCSSVDTYSSTVHYLSAVFHVVQFSVSFISNDVCTLKFILALGT